MSEQRERLAAVVAEIRALHSGTHDAPDDVRLMVKRLDRASAGVSLTSPPYASVLDRLRADIAAEITPAIRKDATFHARQEMERKLEVARAELEKQLRREEGERLEREVAAQRRYDALPRWRRVLACRPKPIGGRR